MAKAATTAQEHEFVLSQQDFQFLAQLVGEKTGIVLGDHKFNMVYSRLARRVRSLGMKDFSTYCALLKNDSGDELHHLVNAITTNLTHFFREKHHFEHLQTHVEYLKTARPDKKIRIWSAGCSSGMEAYSIAMTLHATLPENAQYDSLILATDIDTNMLAQGARAEYPIQEKGNIPIAYHRYIEKENKESFTLHPALRNKVRFKVLNLLDPWPMQGMFDVIFCRNVVIYFDKKTQKALFERMADRLKADGILYIGHSESLHKISNRFELMGRTIYRKIQ